MAFGPGPGYFDDAEEGNWKQTQGVGGPPVPSGGWIGNTASKVANPDIQEFKDLLAKHNPRFLDVSNQLAGIAGGEDPRFEAFRQQRLGDAAAQNASFFGRMGTGGSTAALNQLQRTQGSITAELGMAQLQRQDQARLSSLDVLRGFLENDTIPIQLRMQMMAAQNAGGSGGGGLFGGGGALGLGL